jgi:hypothetical protein
MLTKSIENELVGVWGVFVYAIWEWAMGDGRGWMDVGVGGL